LATSSDNHPAVCYADNEALQDDKVGRIVVDCGYTKNYFSWQEAGTARYIVNACVWLLGLEHKTLHKIPIIGKNSTEGKEITKQIKKEEEEGEGEDEDEDEQTTTTTTTTTTDDNNGDDTSITSNVNNLNIDENNSNNNNNNTNNNSSKRKSWWGSIFNKK